jgi:hypothetical protein
MRRTSVLVRVSGDGRQVMLQRRFFDRELPVTRLSFRLYADYETWFQSGPRVRITLKLQLQAANQPATHQYARLSTVQSLNRNASAAVRAWLLQRFVR